MISFYFNSFNIIEMCLHTKNVHGHSRFILRRLNVSRAEKIRAIRHRIYLIIIFALSAHGSFYTIQTYDTSQSSLFHLAVSEFYHEFGENVPL